VKFGPLLHAKFHPHRRFALRAMLPVITVEFYGYVRTVKTGQLLLFALHHYEH